MHVDSGTECLHQIFVFRKMRQQRQFDLGIVGGNEQTARRRKEGTADLPAVFFPHGNILQIRIPAGKPPGCGAGLDKTGVDPAVFIRKFRQRVRICGFQFGQRTVLQNFLRQRISGSKVFQHAGVRGKPAFCFFTRRQFPFYKQNFLQLLGRSDIEGMAGFVINFLFGFFYLSAQFRGKVPQVPAVHGNSGGFHFSQNGYERHLNIAENIFHTAGSQFRRKEFIQPECKVGVFRSIACGGFQRYAGKCFPGFHQILEFHALAAEQAFCQDFQRKRLEVRIRHPCCNHRIKQAADGLSGSGPRHHLQVEFSVMDDEKKIRRSKQPPDLRQRFLLRNPAGIRPVHTGQRDVNAFSGADGE